MRLDDTILDDINPYPSHDAERWSESPAGQRTLTRVLDQISGDVAVFDQRVERRRRPWLVAVAAAVAVVVAVAIPVVILGSSSQGDAPGSGTVGAEPGRAELTVEETRQIAVWANQLGLNQVDPAVWRDRFDRMCSEGVWNPNVALTLAGEFIATDLDAGASVRSEGIGPPNVEDGATALWLMAVNTCRDRFPEGAIEQGPPAFGE